MPCMQAPRWQRAVISVARLLALSCLAIASHACGPAVQLASSAAVGAFLGYSGLRKGSLSRSGKPLFLKPHMHTLLMQLHHVYLF